MSQADSNLFCKAIDFKPHAKYKFYRPKQNRNIFNSHSIGNNIKEQDWFKFPEIIFTLFSKKNHVESEATVYTVVLMILLIKQKSPFQLKRAFPF